MRRLLVPVLAVATLAVPAAADAAVRRTLTTQFDRQPVLRTQSGRPPGQLVRQRIVAGTGPAAATGDTLKVRYVLGRWPRARVIEDGWRGTEVDPATGAVDPGTFGFRLGARAVIAGWERGLRGARAGERVQLTIPPRLAYGGRRVSEDLPARSTLVFVIDVLAVEPG